MNWEEHLEYLNSSSMEELDNKIAEQVSQQNESAKDSMNEIHYILALAKTDSEILQMIREVEFDYNNATYASPKHHIQKHRKKEYEKDPEAYRIMCEEMSEYAKKFKINDSENE